MTKKVVDWYFDFISPFAYLSSEKLDRISESCEIRPQPILFAGLLQHWQTKGPAEIDPMRKFTFRHISWLAKKNGIPLNLPPEHPFNPLPYLRLSLAMNNDLTIVRRLFRFIWGEGGTISNTSAWQALISELKIENYEALIGDPMVKDSLRSNTEKAVKNNLFGVPGFVVDNETFWGFDSMDFMIDYLENPELLKSAAIQAADHLPEGRGRTNR
ncbi:MAG: 2-hydroxychromene-2-carboxylate isomerase [Gammaproteobacteria bacterium]|jgi:2-hydroxychromene-2-carboxylate isomerase